MTEKNKIHIAARIPSDLWEGISKLINETGKDKTTIISDLLQLGLDALEGIPLGNVLNPVDLTTFNTAIARLETLITGKSIETPVIDANQEASNVFYEVLTHGLNHKEVLEFYLQENPEDIHDVGWVRQQGSGHKTININGLDYFYLKKVGLWFPVNVLTPINTDDTNENAL